MTDKEITERRRKRADIERRLAAGEEISDEEIAPFVDEPGGDIDLETPSYIQPKPDAQD